jgi:hypothetical protein
MRIFLLSLIVTTSVTAAFAQRSLDSKLGMAMPSDGKPCLLTRSSSLKQGQRISIIQFDEWNGPRQRILSGKVGKKDPTGCDDFGGEHPMHPYGLSLKSNDVVLGIAIVPSIRLKRYGKLVRADLNGDGRWERFRICWSSEGAHLTVWSGIPLKSKRLWHAYYYAGYDTEPNCSKKDYL